VIRFSFSDPDAAEDIPWIRIILRQMRLLDCIVDGNILNERLFAVLDAAPLPVSSSLKYVFFAVFTFLTKDEERK